MISGRKEKEDIDKQYSLRDFTRLALAFLGALLVLGLYQQLRLYAQGVLDQIIGKSFLLLSIHHLGFAALAVLPLAFLFKSLERRKASLGFKSVLAILSCLLLLEGILVDYYVTYFEIAGQGIISIYPARTSVGELLLTLSILAPMCLGSFFLFYRLSSGTYQLIGRMYPFTIILFSLFLATQYSDKKPINENKVQHLLVDTVGNWLDINTYEGSREYPLLAEFTPDREMAPLFRLGESPPNLVLIIMDGIGSEFVGPQAPYRDFAPFLNSLRKESIYWPNHLSNTTESHSSLPGIVGSLPYGESGFTEASGNINRNTLLGILKKNGYFTSFSYGGNTALHQWDKFLFEDRIDRMLDIKAFGQGYEKQKEDAAGNSLGFPDKEIYRRWLQEQSEQRPPFAEIFFTLSTKNPYSIPDAEHYEKRVEVLATKMIDDRPGSKSVRRNKELLASVLYADEALGEFIDRYKKLPYYENTIFLITGSHMMPELPSLDPLSRYRVPLLLYSPMLEEAKVVKKLVSHLDIAPAILGLLSDRYSMSLPGEASFLGCGLLTESLPDSQRQIPLFRHKSGIKDFIYGNYLLTDGYLYEIGPGLSLKDTDTDSLDVLVETRFKEFKAINSYVVKQNRLIPDSAVLFTQNARTPTKQEMIWINSVFNGSDFDNAYETARSLAFDGERDRALLLCSYILSQAPGHADTEILMGRIHAWEGAYDEAIEILETAVMKYPVYSDAYGALLDAYFWSGQKGKIDMFEKWIKRYHLYGGDLVNKINRVKSLETSAGNNYEKGAGVELPVLEKTAAIKYEE